MLNSDSSGDLGISKEKMDEFLQVSQALKTIRDQRLFRQEFTSFDAYCRTKWGIPGPVAERFIAEADLERQARKANRELQ